MIRNVLSHMNGVGIYGIASILLFFVTFAGAVIHALCQKRSLMQELASLPLVDQETSKNPEAQSRHEPVP